MANTNTVHALRVFYNNDTQTYSGELRIVKQPVPKIAYHGAQRKHTQTERWPDGKVKQIKHRHFEAVPFETNPVNPKRGTRAWKEARKRFN